MQRLRMVAEGAVADPDVLSAMLAEALRFSEEELAPLDAVADRTGCALHSGRVVLPSGHREAWCAYRAAGWAGAGISSRYGGLGLPQIVSIALQECFDRASISFGMVPGSARAAARLLEAHAAPEIVQEWVPKLACGEWAATICVSEAGAGSDVGRISTRARRDASGQWLIGGEKLWISFADHDLTERIGHIVLARPQGASAGVKGLSLFLVPSVVEREGRGLERNRVVVRRLEDKLGLHGSPTCALGFEDAQGTLIGAESRGVAQLFEMIVAMRLQVGTQGLGLAGASYRAAFAYAHERCQGGPWQAPPVPIAAHPDVQLTLMGMASRIATLRGLVYAGAIAGDLAEAERGVGAGTDSRLLQAWLLPIIKNSGADTGFDVAADAIVLFGGAGYTREWPVERHLRDARVLAIYEGTAGMQALDLVRRRWRHLGTGYEAFYAAASADVPRLPKLLSAPLREGLAVIAEASLWLRDPSREEWELDAGARSALRLATEVAHGWIGARLAALEGGDAASQQLAACGRHALSVLQERAGALLVALRDAPRRQQNCRALGFEVAG
jgi:hypothetical protein